MDVRRGDLRREISARAFVAADALKRTLRPKSDEGQAVPHSVAAWRRRIFEIIEIGHGESRASRIFDTAIVTLILLNIAAFVAETVPWLSAAYAPYFTAFEIFSVVVFSIEYGLRLWTAVEVPFLKRLPAWKARLTLALRPALLIDLLAILPFFLGMFLSIDLRILRALRLLRFFKLSRYSPAMHTLLRVLVNEQRALIGAGLLLLTVVLFASTGIYYIEGSAQPDKFGSVPDAAWWAIATLTTVGYGDVAPITTFGRLFGSVVMVTGLCILALPVAIISAGFAQELGRRDFVVTWSLMSRIPLLADLEAGVVEKIMPLLQAHNLPPNVEVLGEEQVGNAIFFIASGQVLLRSTEGERIYSKGDFFGVVAMLERDFTQGSFVTKSKCRLLKLHSEDFHRLETASPEIGELLRRKARERREESAAT
ncbi:cyclic nucleotide-gated ion channel [Hyphomicrobium sp. LHD-15]|uniref:cyclic nucleotide-gated ion channel n=1 Tax=Hyphomicrobium sp. LHD-15 TaxID=3072142 RepID=UPI00280DC8E6|nr:cyclic nucleotide-gated ion channel [Hyphomicrobium sp. LHD-15]MDQ8699988.1 cyclic nucleotide-gated ion channel [Hyphomicrobium sp. LHD-15]